MGGVTVLPALGADLGLLLLSEVLILPLLPLIGFAQRATPLLQAGAHADFANDLLAVPRTPSPAGTMSNVISRNIEQQATPWRQVNASQTWSGQGFRYMAVNRHA